VPFDALRDAPRGLYLDAEPERVLPADPGSTHRFQLLPADVAAELSGVAAEVAPREFAYRLAARRLRDALKSACKDLPAIRQRVPTNPAFMNPADMAREGIAEGQLVRIRSEGGEILLPARADPDLRSGVVSVAHGFGGLPDDPEEPFTRGANTNRLISAGGPRESINAMPRMSAIPVNVSPVADLE
jgi:anaerobic selenocysteine-containing dehydrogenase